MDEFIDKWALEAEEIYAAQTAGDYTWQGFLAKFVREAVELGIIEVIDQ